VGRKSRAKAARRAERAQFVHAKSPPGLSGLSEAANFSPAAVAAPPLARLPASGRSSAADHLRRLLERQGELQGEIEDEVRRLLAQGESWTVVGRALGLSRQGARQRYRHLATVNLEAVFGNDGPPG
jgi:hypothetical protein